MNFHIRHTTRHEYSQPVFLEPHTLRLRPRCDAAQRVHRCDLELRPMPAGMSEGIDAEGNHFACAWFNGLVAGLEIEVQLEVETLRPNPFDYLLLEPGTSRVPATYPADVLAVLAPALAASGDATVAEFAAQVSEHGDPSTPGFLLALTETLYQGWTVVVREQGPPLAAGRTLHDRNGSCRDLTVLFMETCRAVGLATRFVSGYQEGDLHQEQRYLHAWPEVYLPGAGWRGYDPTLGLIVADRHVAVAASVNPPGAAPISGTYRGDGIALTPSIDLEITTSPSPLPATGNEEQQ